MIIYIIYHLFCFLFFIGIAAEEKERMPNQVTTGWYLKILVEAFIKSPINLPITLGYHFFKG